jgi:glutamine amidotransferase
MITILNYGIGNIKAFQNIYNRLGITVEIATSSYQLSLAKKIILPGVGSFDWAMERLNNSGMRSTLEEMVLNYKIPVLGVCVGMQMMAESSEEGILPGLGWINAKVKRFEENKLRLPHMGWNNVSPKENHPLFKDIIYPKFYFLHSYYFSPETENLALATTEYGFQFTSVAYTDHIYGVQFHPEKSHFWGIQLLKNFAYL